MTCKAGTELLRKLATPTLAAIALMLSTTLPAHPQAFHQQLSAQILVLADFNTYSCDVSVVGTPSGIDNWKCQATLTDGTPVTQGVKSEAFVFATLPNGFTLAFRAEVEERPDGTANVTAHI